MRSCCSTSVNVELFNVNTWLDRHTRIVHTGYAQMERTPAQMERKLNEHHIIKQKKKMNQTPKQNSAK